MIIDSHTHVFPEHVADRAMEALSARYGATPVGRASPSGLLREMDSCGVDRAVLAAVATRPGQVASINSWLAEIRSDRLWPLGALHPHLPDPASEIQRLLDAGFRGVKLHCHFQEFGMDDPALDRLLDLIGDKLVVLMHCGDEIAPLERVEPTPPRILAMHQRHPEVRLILAHLGGYQEWDEAEALLVGQDVCLDISYVFGHCSDEQIARMVRAHGTDRILWGSDFPWESERHALAGLDRLALSADERQAVLCGNVQRVLGL